MDRHYLAITQTVAKPNPLRIRYREILIQTVQAIVQGRHAPSKKNIKKLMANQVPEIDRAEFVKIAFDALKHLHEGNVARYRLKLSEFQAWTSVREAR